jgi:cytidine deaminase
MGFTCERVAEVEETLECDVPELPCGYCRQNTHDDCQEKKLLLMVGRGKIGAWIVLTRMLISIRNTNTTIADFATKTFRILDMEEVNFDITNRSD